MCSRISYIYPPLKPLYLKGVAKVPITFFLQIVHLTTLKLHSLSPNDFGDENASSLTLAASKGVIDRCLWHIEEEEEHVRCTRFPSSVYLSLIQDIDGPTDSIFLPFMCRLRFFEISVHLGCATMHDFDILSLMGSRCISLTSPATLEHLQFSIWFSGDDNMFMYRAYAFFEDLRYAEAWSHLDSITTYPTGSQLQRVDISIRYCFRCDDNGRELDWKEVEKAVFDGLPLLRAKGILFVEASVDD